MTKNTKLLDSVKKQGFNNLEDYVKENMHYLPKNKQKIFKNISTGKNESNEVKYGKG